MCSTKPFEKTFDLIMHTYSILKTVLTLLIVVLRNFQKIREKYSKKRTNKRPNIVIVIGQNNENRSNNAKIVQIGQKRSITCARN